MRLTDRQRDMLEGKEGEGKKIAMRIVTQMGKLYGAERLLPVHSAHMDGCCYTTVWDAGLEFVEYLVRIGTRVEVPSTTNITARDARAWGVLKIPADFSEKCRRIEEAYTKLGCIPTWSCAPYQCTNIPHFGEHAAWSESNAVNYINSVVGARTNRYPDLVDLCCAITGYVPEFGLHVTENRAGQYLYRLEGFPAGSFSDSSDYALLGYLIGRMCGSKIPVIEGLPQRTTHDDLKALSAASAAGGSVGLFHAVGITPEAPSSEAAFQGKEPECTVIIRPEDLDRVKGELTNAGGGHVDLVVVGCPHASYPEMQRILTLMNGKKAKKGTQFWLQTGQPQKDLARRSGLLEALEGLGVFVMQDSCINNFPVKNWGFQTIVTNSGKMAHYAPGTAGAVVVFCDLAGCISAATEGSVSS